MRFNSVRTGNYSQSAKAVVRASDQIFDAAMSGKPDFTSISKEAIKGRSLERQAVTQAEGNVAQAGLEAFTKAKRTKNAVETEKAIADIKRPAKRMAGIVAGLGAISSAAMTMKSNQEAKAEREKFKAEQNAILTKQGEMMAGMKAKQDAWMQQLEASLTKPTDSPTSPSPSPTPSDSSASPSPSSSPSSSPPSGTSISPSPSPTSSGSGIKPTGEGGLYSQSDIRRLAEQVGFSPSNAAIVAAIGMGESGGKAGIDTVQSGLDPGKKNEFSVGLMQINTKAHMDKLTRRGWSVEDLRDPLKNMTITKEVFDEAGGSFKPWGAYTNGSYTKFLK